MQVVVQVVEGPEVGRQIWLGRGQVAEVGNSDTLDLGLPSDRELAKVHFSLRCDAKFCTLRDLSGGKGVWVNGEPVSETKLRHGDYIFAGQTSFHVSIQGGGELPPAPAPAAAEPVATPVAAKPKKFVDPILHDGERSFRRGMEAMEENGPIQDQPADVQHAYATYASGLASILELLDKKEEAAQYKQLSNELLASPKVKEYLKP